MVNVSRYASSGVESGIGTGGCPGTGETFRDLVVSACVWRPDARSLRPLYAAKRTYTLAGGIRVWHRAVRCARGTTGPDTQSQA